VILAGISSAAEPMRRLPPPENGPADSGLISLLASMRRIAESRDAAALTRLMRPDFRVEFDVGKGPLAFRRHWRAESRESSVWGVLGKALAMEGAFCMPSLFCIPYLYVSFPRDLDPFAHVVATRSDVVLRDRPSQEGAAVRRLDRSIVRLEKPLPVPALIPGDGFLSIDDPAAGRGYLAGPEVYSPAGHRMFFERRSGRWQWISLAAATLADPPELKRPPARARG
jgi:hypothetical protein